MGSNPFNLDNETVLKLCDIVIAYEIKGYKRVLWRKDPEEIFRMLRDIIHIQDHKLLKMAKAFFTNIPKETQEHFTAKGVNPFRPARATSNEKMAGQHI